jgi:hypothetical protein
MLIFLGTWKHDNHLGPLADYAGDINLAFVGLDDGLAKAQSQPKATCLARA